MTLIGRNLMMQRRLFWLENIYFESMLDKSGFGAGNKMGGFALENSQKYPWHQNLFGHPYSLHQHQSEQLLYDMSQLFFYLWFPEHKYTNTDANPSVISSDPAFCLFECLFSDFLNNWV